MPASKSKALPHCTYNLRSGLTRLRSGMRTKAGGPNPPVAISQSKGPIRRKAKRKKASGNSRSAANGQSSRGMKCAICLDTERTYRMQYMPCGHSFHEKCCLRWLSQSGMCPVCRTPVLATSMAPFNPNAPTRNSRRPHTRRRRHVVIRQRFRDMLLSSTSVIIIDVYRFRQPPSR